MLSCWDVNWENCHPLTWDYLWEQYIKPNQCGMGWKKKLE